ncbi:MAG: nicotinate phosphoribosyltransferase [Leptolinea sp.]
MGLFDGERLDNSVFKLDVDRMRRGWYTDKYFVNITNMLTILASQKYTYCGTSPRLPKGIDPCGVEAGDLEVEMQWFTRKDGHTVVVGVDKSLTMLRHCTGYFDGDTYVDKSDKLEVWAVHDGSIVTGTGDAREILPVIRVRGRYRDFALLETPTLGILARASRVATNVYDTLVAARGKPILFFPARFDIHEVQAADGYAYNIAVQRFNMDFARKLGPYISTDAQGDWWGGFGGGTVAHAAIACFLGDTPEAMLAFARTMPPSISRIALVDFNNDCVRDSLQVCKVMFEKYKELMVAGDLTEAERYRLYGVRLDTSASLRDVSIQPLGDPALDLGVTPRLVFALRLALDSAWESWDIPAAWRERAREYCRAVKIVVSGGFNPDRIRKFEKLSVPVDIYAVGSSLFDNHGPTVNDYTADVVRIKINGDWIDMAKVGRQHCDNSDLERVW